MSGTPGTLTGPNLPGSRESRSGDSGAFRGQGIGRSYLEVAAVPSAVPHARRCTKHTLAAWQLGQIADDAELVVSELMTNAIRATVEMQLAAHVVLYLAADHSRLTLLVWDACPEPPVSRPHEDDAAGSRGLEIVEVLSDKWGTWAPAQGGKVVWAWFDLDRP
jgi:anti-sigma regulatory factor (Ser/Thr protein kinase)